MRKTLSILFAAAFVGGAVIAIAAQGDAKAGEALYGTKKCATCHQLKGQGNKVAAALDDAGKLSAADLKLWLTDPAVMEAKLAKKPAMSMAGWLKTAKLTDADVAALVAYMQTLKK